MKASWILRTAVRSLRRAPLRSALTALGVMFGGGAVLAIFAIGQGAKDRVEELSDDIRYTRFVLILGPDRGQKLDPLQDRMNEADQEEIRAKVPVIVEHQLLTVFKPSQVRVREKYTPAMFFGSSEAQFGSEVLEGEKFGKWEVENRALVCLANQSFLRELFPNQSPLGRRVAVGNLVFTVIGVIADLRTSEPGAMGVFVIPWTTLLSRIDPATEVRLAFRVLRQTAVAEAERKARQVFEQRRGNRRGQLVVGGVASELDRYIARTRTMTALLGAVAGISLLVGGIGIINIMMVSVSQRTREIGLRLAVGTAPRDILWQFLAEAVVISLIGGIFGLGGGSIAAQIVGRANDWPVAIAPQGVMAVIGLSVVVGVVFGWYPAWRASRMHPIEALRRA